MYSSNGVERAIILNALRIIPRNTHDEREREGETMAMSSTYLVSVSRSSSGSMAGSPTPTEHGYRPKEKPAPHSRPHSLGSLIQANVDLRSDFHF